MSIERMIGVDFGTSTSVVRVKRYEDGKSVGENLDFKEVTFDGSGSITPTLITKKKDGSVSFYGNEARKVRKNYQQFHSFKMDLENQDEEKQAQARMLTEEFYGYLAKQYKNQSNGGHLGDYDDKERTIISYPVKWSDDVKKFMISSAQKAGFPNVVGMDEAQAAIHAVTVMSNRHLNNLGLLKDGQSVNILLIDMGAGTTDIVLAKYTPGKAAKTEILCTYPKDGEISFGGREIDQLLQEYFRQLLKDRADEILPKIGLEKFKMWKEDSLSPALKASEALYDFDELDNYAEILNIDLDYKIDRGVFEDCTRELLKQFPVLIQGCLKEAGVDGSVIDLVITTGGHSQWYFVNDMLVDKMPDFGQIGLSKIINDPSRIIQIARPQETVALGLIYSGVELHRETPLRRKGEDSPKKEITENIPTNKNFEKTLTEMLKEEPRGAYHGKLVEAFQESTAAKPVVVLPPQAKTKRDIYSFGDLVQEFIECVQAPPIKNGIEDLPSDFVRQLKEYNGLPREEKIIYTFKQGYYGAAYARSPSWRFLFTDTYFVVPHFNALELPTKGDKILWRDFVSMEIGDMQRLGMRYLTFAGKRVHAMYYGDPLVTKGRVDKWRYFYMDLQDYIRNNAYRIKKR